MNVLIVEDDQKISDYLKRSFKDNDIVSDVTADGRIGLNKALFNKYDVLILDIAVPGLSGKEICSKLREINKNIPVLILSAQHSTESKLDLFDVGADDYVTKPFVFEELFARVKALLRRNNNNDNKNIIIIDDLIICLDKKSVERNKKEIKLTRFEFSMLVLLAQNKGKVLSRTYILNNIHEDSLDILPNAVNVHISALRTKIDKEFENKLIHTVRGFGYKISE